LDVGFHTCHVVLIKVWLGRLDWCQRLKIEGEQQVQSGKDDVNVTCTLVGSPVLHSSGGMVPVIEVSSMYKRCNDSIFP
jgi:hypothetical protein